MWGHLLCGDTIYVVLMHLLINDFIAHGLDKNIRRKSVSTSVKTWQKGDISSICLGANTPILVLI